MKDRLALDHRTIFRGDIAGGQRVILNDEIAEAPERVLSIRLLAGVIGIVTGIQQSLIALIRTKLNDI